VDAADPGRANTRLEKIEEDRARPAPLVPGEQVDMKVRRVPLEHVLHGAMCGAHPAEVHEGAEGLRVTPPAHRQRPQKNPRNHAATEATRLGARVGRAQDIAGDPAVGIDGDERVFRLVDRIVEREEQREKATVVEAAAAFTVSDSLTGQAWDPDFYRDEVDAGLDALVAAGLPVLAG